MEDTPAWQFYQTGVFSVKSAYKLDIRLRDQHMHRDASSSTAEDTTLSEFPWNRIWNLQLPNKVKMFLWRLAHNSLPLRVNLRRRGVNLDTIYPLCSRLDEDGPHSFFRCKAVKACRRQINLENITLELQQHASVEDVF